MRSSVLLIAGFVWSTLAWGQTGLTPDIITKRLSKNDARVVVRNMYDDGREWRLFLTGVATGKPEWLTLAIKLVPGTDAGATSQLFLSIGEALEHQPQNVLRIAVSELGTGKVCGGPDVDDSRYDSYALSIKAIELRKTMLLKVDDSKLFKVRDACIKELDSSKQGIARFYGVRK
jgi:hypothetical protein